MVHRALAIATVACAAAALPIGCSPQEASGSAVVTQESLAGLYRLQGMAQTSGVGRVELRLNEDGSFLYTNLQSNFSGEGRRAGDWRIKDDRILMHIVKDGKRYPMPFMELQIDGRDLVPISEGMRGRRFSK